MNKNDSNFLDEETDIGKERFYKYCSNVYSKDDYSKLGRLNNYTVILQYSCFSCLKLINSEDKICRNCGEYTCNSCLLNNKPKCCEAADHCSLFAKIKASLQIIEAPCFFCVSDKSHNTHLNIYSLVELEIHIETCDNRNIKCNGCLSILPFNQFQNHIEKCDSLIVKCEYCSYTGSYSQVKIHEVYCTEKYKICNYCNVKVKVNLVNFHDHLVCLNLIIDNYESSLLTSFHDDKNISVLSNQVSELKMFLLRKFKSVLPKTNTGVNPKSPSDEINNVTYKPLQLQSESFAVEIESEPPNNLKNTNKRRMSSISENQIIGADYSIGKFKENKNEFDYNNGNNVVQDRKTSKYPIESLNIEDDQICEVEQREYNQSTYSEKEVFIDNIYKKIFLLDIVSLDVKELSTDYMTVINQANSLKIPGNTSLHVALKDPIKLRKVQIVLTSSKYNRASTNENITLCSLDGKSTEIGKILINPINSEECLLHDGSKEINIKPASEFLIINETYDDFNLEYFKLN